MPFLNTRTTTPDVRNGTLNLRPIDVFNTIRNEASGAYRDAVPELEVDERGSNIVAVGQAVLGNPTYLNEFLPSLVNRIALVRVASMLFHNPLADLKKGTVELGASVSHTFISLITPQPFDIESAGDREFKRSLPKDKTEFYVPNSRLQFPITIDYRDIERAFTSYDGVNDMIERIVAQLATSGEYADFLLTEYVVRVAALTGEVHMIGVDPTDPEELAVALRSLAGQWSLPSTKYNRRHVRNRAETEDIVVLMTARQRARFDVGVLARAFNMDKADFLGRVITVNEFGEFDEEFFESVYTDSKQMVRLAPEDVELLDSMLAFVADRNYFQFYENSVRLTTTQVGAGLYTNYWLTIERTYATSGFANATAIFDSTSLKALPAALSYVVTQKTDSDGVVSLSFAPNFNFAGVTPAQIEWVQTGVNVEASIAIQKSAVTFSKTSPATAEVLIEIGDALYTADVAKALAVGDVVTINKL